MAGRGKRVTFKSIAMKAYERSLINPTASEVINYYFIPSINILMFTFAPKCNIIILERGVFNV